MGKLLKHILLAKFKADTPPQRVDALIKQYEALHSSIQAMKAFEWGTDVSVENANEGFTHAFVSTFESAEGRDAYLFHPAHVAYSKQLLPALEKYLVVDYVANVVLAYNE